MVYSSVSIILSAIDTITSRTFINVFNQSAVNVIVGCILLVLSMKAFSSPCSQRENISSIYLNHRCGLNSAFRRIFYSSSTINRILYGVASFVPIEVPVFSFNVFLFSYLKILFLNTTSARSQSVLLRYIFHSVT